MWWLFAALAALVLLMPRTALAYIAGKRAEIELGPIGNGQFLRADAARAYRRMAAAAAAAGVFLFAESGFRTMEQQGRLYALYLAGQGNQAATPGHSNHQSGIAVDIRVQRSFTSREYLWLEANAAAFGFTNTGSRFAQPEPHHWEYR